MSDRRAGWLSGPIQTSLRCRHGHRIRDGWLITTSGPVRCQDCSSLVWVIRTLDDAHYVADITAADVPLLKAHTTIHQTLAYLGAPLLDCA